MKGAMENRQLIRHGRNNRSSAILGFQLSVVSFLFFITVAGGAASGERVERRERPAPTARAVVSLRAQTVVRGTEMRLGDVAEIQGHDPVLVERLRGIDVGRAPLPGHTRTLDLS